MEACLHLAVELGEPKGAREAQHPNFSQPLPSGPFHSPQTCSTKTTALLTEAFMLGCKTGEQGWGCP